jgi:hypothetical protein
VYWAVKVQLTENVFVTESATMVCDTTHSLTEQEYADCYYYCACSLDEKAGVQAKTY